MIFLDSNIFVYSADATDKAKQNRAYSIIKNAVDNPSFVISSQVLNEFSNSSRFQNSGKAFSRWLDS